MPFPRNELNSLIPMEFLTATTIGVNGPFWAVLPILVISLWPLPVMAIPCLPKFRNTLVKLFLPQLQGRRLSCLYVCKRTAAGTIDVLDSTKSHSGEVD